MTARPALLHLDGWAGRVSHRVHVVGETPKRYRITPAGDERVRLAGAYRYLRPGDTALVPRYAITFEEGAAE